MKYEVDHDFHIHSTISPCCHDENQTPETILNYAKENNFKSICQIFTQMYAFFVNMEYKFKVFAQRKSRNSLRRNSCLDYVNKFQSITSYPELPEPLPEALPEVFREFFLQVC